MIDQTIIMEIVKIILLVLASMNILAITFSLIKNKVWWTIGLSALEIILIGGILFI